MAAARLETPNHDRITRSPRTAPVAGSTFSAPKKCWRAASVAFVAALASVAAAPASTPAHASTQSHLIVIPRLPCWIDKIPAVKGIATDKVDRWLAEHVEGAVAPFEYRLIAGGHSNLT